MNATLPAEPAELADEQTTATSSEPLAPALPPPAAAPPRLVSLDAFRGLAMVLMASAGLSLGAVGKWKQTLPDIAHGELAGLGLGDMLNSAGRSLARFVNVLNETPVWHQLKWHTDHTEWAGCTLWDLIQPCFMFMVGAALPFSIASRVAKGQKFGRMFAHAAWRALALTLLGVFLASNSSRAVMTNWLFTNVLAQIGLGYVFLFLLAWLRPRWQLAVAGGILVAYWLLFALYPAPAAGFDFATVNAADWAFSPHGFGAHWDKNTNAAMAFDRWFLHLFPRQETFVGEAGGYATLNFVPSLVTMTFGLLAGQLLRSPAPAGRKLLTLTAAGVAGLGLGYGLAYLNVCPLVKRIWTPSWAIYSAGWAFVGLAFFYLVCDVARLRKWSYPLVIVGMNSIAVYLLSNTMKPFFADTVRRHFGQGVFVRVANLFGGPEFTPVVQSATMLLIVWAIALWMHRRRIFLKV